MLVFQESRRKLPPQRTTLQHAALPGSSEQEPAASASRRTLRCQQAVQAGVRTGLPTLSLQDGAGDAVSAVVVHECGREREAGGWMSHSPHAVGGWHDLRKEKCPSKNFCLCLRTISDCILLLQWCQRGACVPKHRHEAVDGGWSDWKEFGECSRTCGGGVKKSSRKCNDPPPRHGGRYCRGDNVRYTSCNTQHCSASGVDTFRDDQCAAHNNNNKNIPNISRHVKWRPTYNG